MHPLVLIPLAACILCGAYCLTATPATYNMVNRRLRWIGKMLFACPAVWAFSEVGMLLARNASAAESFVPIAASAIIMIGPLAVDVAQSIANESRTTVTRSTQAVYAAGGLLVVSAWFTPWCFRGVVAVPWGYALDPGPLFPAYVGFVLGCAVFTYRRCREVVAEAMDLDETAGGRGIARWVMALVLVGSLTDAVLPVFGIQVPRLTTAGFGLLAAGILWSMTRPQGYVFASQALISREILRSIHEGVVFVTLDDRVLLANEGMETFLGAAADEIVGGPFQQHLPALDLGEPQERIDVECPLRPAVGAPISVAASVSTARDHRGEVLGLVVVVRDLRQIELLRSQLITSGRLAAVGELAAGIAHEINNPLAFVRTNLGVLRDHWSDVAAALDDASRRPEAAEALKEGEEIIGESIEGVDRAARIVRDVREFSHAGRPEREHVEVNDLLDRVLRISTTKLARGTTIERHYGDVPRIPASPQQLEQVFLNLIVNAIHATGGNGRVTVSTCQEAGAVIVRVSDDGCGIAPDVVDRIFDPFFTTKSVGEGTGLGLSISHQIVTNHEGEITVEPGAEGGACFRVSLPVELSSSVS